jgi:hypothetical protein
MLEKYVDEAVGIWMIWGTSLDGKYHDVADQNKDLFTCLPVAEANAVVQLQQEFREKLYKILCTKE